MWCYFIHNLLLGAVQIFTLGGKPVKMCTSCGKIYGQQPTESGPVEEPDFSEFILRNDPDSIEKEKKDDATGDF